jgi:hypothetical protein
MKRLTTAAHHIRLECSRSRIHRERRGDDPNVCGARYSEMRSQKQTIYQLSSSIRGPELGGAFACESG